MGDPSLVLSLGSLERLSSSRFSFFELLPLLSKERERERENRECVSLGKW